MPRYLIGWLLGAALGGVALGWSMRRAGYGGREIAIVFAALTAAIVVGSKLLYLAETLSGGGGAPFTAALLSPYMRIPGGIALAVLLGPWIARAIGSAFLAYADTVTPAAGLLLAGIRVGCFLEGCCFGLPTSLPWGVTFPPGSEAFHWQVATGAIHPSAACTQPLHALQVYFGLVGIALFVALLHRQRRTRFDGEILLLFGLGYFWSTWLLEFLRAVPHPTAHAATLIAGVAATLAYLVVRRRGAMQ